MADNAGPSGPPPPLTPLDFQNGEPTINKKAFVKACRELVRARVGPGVANWRDVSNDLRYDMFKTLQRGFALDGSEFEYVMTLMCSQLKTWKYETRKKYIGKDMSAADILKLKSVNKMKKVSNEHWRQFIENEATELKLRQRELGRENRSHYDEPHRMGSTSYHELARRRSSLGLPEMDRSDLYLEARTDKKSGSLHPKAAATAKRIAEERSLVDELDQYSVDRDILSRTLGRDSHGRVRGYSSKQSKTSLKSFFNNFSCKKADVVTKNDLDNILSRLSAVENRPSSSHVPPSSDPVISTSRRSASTSRRSAGRRSPDSSTSHVPPPITSQVSPPISNSSTLHKIISHVNFDHIAYGYGPRVPLLGEDVNGVTCNQRERVITITEVMQGKETSALYMPLANADTVTEAKYCPVIWPINLCIPID